jgi:hypothetical protein
MRARAFSDDPDTATEDAKPEPEYVFDGFNVEFSSKIALTPPTAAKRPDAKQRQDAK